MHIFFLSLSSSLFRYLRSFSTIGIAVSTNDVRTEDHCCYVHRFRRSLLAAIMYVIVCRLLVSEIEYARTHAANAPDSRFAIAVRCRHHRTSENTQEYTEPIGYRKSQFVSAHDSYRRSFVANNSFRKESKNARTLTNMYTEQCAAPYADSGIFPDTDTIHHRHRHPECALTEDRCIYPNPVEDLVRLSIESGTHNRTMCIFARYAQNADQLGYTYASGGTPFGWWTVGWGGDGRPGTAAHPERMSRRIGCHGWEIAVCARSDRIESIDFVGHKPV